MNTVTTAAELDALPVGSAAMGSDGNVWQRVGGRVSWQSLTGGGYTFVTDLIRECAPLTVLYRPDQQPTAQPTARELLWAKVDAWDEGFLAGLTPPCNANPYHADALRADRIEAGR